MSVCSATTASAGVPNHTLATWNGALVLWSLRRGNRCRAVSISQCVFFLPFQCITKHEQCVSLIYNEVYLLQERRWTYDGRRLSASMWKRSVRPKTTASSAQSARHHGCRVDGAAVRLWRQLRQVHDRKWNVSCTSYIALLYIRIFINYIYTTHPIDFDYPHIIGPPNMMVGAPLRSYIYSIALLVRGATANDSGRSRTAPITCPEWIVVSVNCACIIFQYT